MHSYAWSEPTQPGIGPQVYGTPSTSTPVPIPMGEDNLAYGRPALQSGTTQAGPLGVYSMANKATDGMLVPGTMTTTDASASCAVGAAVPNPWW